MSDVVIHARGLRKIYRLYSGPGYRFLDMFGMLGNRAGAYTEHAALDGINLDIRRGEKVAFIGRNGAGKSTLLKLFTKVIEPTSGALEVKGKAHALLQIGSGFHPDFTGRENVYAYLAQLGVAGRKADRKYAEIVEFAELEEYIGQPVKTYSSGMAVRLMFSTSTAITPDLLVLDEILGVGDAYFANKSYNRIRELCDRDGTTLLLVTHDIYSAVNICNRLIWIDRGRVLMDDAGPVVIKAYEDSIRQQEESRLRTRKQERARALAESTKTDRPVLVEVFARGNQPQPSSVYFSRIELLVNGVSAGCLPLGGDAFEEAVLPHLQCEGTCWGEPTEWQGRMARPFLNYGSPFHKVAGLFGLPLDVDVARARVEVAIDYWTDSPCALGARWFPGGHEQPIGELAPVELAWGTFVGTPSADEPTTAGSINSSGRQGTGTVIITDLRALDASGVESHQFTHGERLELRIGYEIRQPDFKESVQVQVAFHKDGAHIVCRFLGRALLLDARHRREGVIRMKVETLPLMVGQYSITAIMVRDGYFDQPQAVYYSINTSVHSSVSRLIDITVASHASIAHGSGVLCDAEWSLD